MAGTMPHAIFVEVELPDGGTAAHAAELPGCAAFGATDAEAVAALPRRAARFAEWLRAKGEDAPLFVGDNWYEVERAAARDGRRATFSLDELPPSRDEFGSWCRWLELAREELADALDGAGPEGAAAALDAIAAQDLDFAEQLGAEAAAASDGPLDRLYAARDALADALDRCGPEALAVRRILRIAIADDLRAAAQLRGSDD